MSLAHPARPRPLDPAAQRLHLPHAARSCASSASWAGRRFTSPRPKHTAPRRHEEDVDGLHFYRTPRRRRRLARAARCWTSWRVMRDTERRLRRGRRGRRAARHPARPFAGAERHRRAAGRRASSASRWSTKCAPSGKTPRSTTAPPPKAACATGCRARWRPGRCGGPTHVTTICEGLRAGHRSRAASRRTRSR